MIHNLPEQGKDLRKEISEILVKWSMPTRQVAISEIVSLIRQAKLERTEEIREELGDIYNHLPISSKRDTDCIIWDIGKRIKKLLSHLTSKQDNDSSEKSPDNV